MKAAKLTIRLILGLVCGYVMFLSLYALADRDLWMFMGLFFCPTTIILLFRIHEITIQEIRDTYNLFD